MMSEEYFKEMTAFLRFEFKNLVEFVYMNAPHVTAEPSAANNFRQQYAWWLKTQDFPCVNFKACFDQTLDYMNKNFLEKGPFDGIFGYSQGMLSFLDLNSNLLNFKKYLKKEEVF